MLFTIFQKENNFRISFLLPRKVECVRQVSISWTLKSFVFGIVGGHCWKLTFFVGGKYLLPGI